MAAPGCNLHRVFLCGAMRLPRIRGCESITEASQSAGGPNPGPYLGQTNMPHTHSISRRTRHRLAHTHTHAKTTQSIGTNMRTNGEHTRVCSFAPGITNITHILCCVPCGAVRLVRDTCFLSRRVRVCVCVCVIRHR